MLTFTLNANAYTGNEINIWIYSNIARVKMVYFTRIHLDHLVQNQRRQKEFDSKTRARRSETPNKNRLKKCHHEILGKSAT